MRVVSGVVIQERGATNATVVNTTLHLGLSTSESSVRQPIRMAVGLSVDLVQVHLLQSCQLQRDRGPKAAETPIACGKYATHLLDDEVAITFDPQVRSSVISSSPGTEQQSSVLGRVVRLAAARHVVGASPHHRATGLEQGSTSTSTARARVGPAGTVKPYQPLARRVGTSSSRIINIQKNRATTRVHVFCLRLLVVQNSLWEETVCYPGRHHAARQ